ncbi:hypothetical protein, partial [Mycobacterium asiaticum]|uniref:hypothetical protein n=1 Tax=Mycobacterium asiaticum TaxID=1790 RepID=UPI001C12C72D
MKLPSVTARTRHSRTPRHARTTRTTHPSRANRTALPPKAGSTRITTTATISASYSRSLDQLWHMLGDVDAVH